MKRYDSVAYSDIVRMAADHKESIITASLLFYVSVYFLLGIVGVGFQAQPAAASYHQDTGGSFWDDPWGNTVDRVSDVGERFYDGTKRFLGGGKEQPSGEETQPAVEQRPEETGGGDETSGWEASSKGFLDLLEEDEGFIGDAAGYLNDGIQKGKEVVDAAEEGYETVTSGGSVDANWNTLTEGAVPLSAGGDSTGVLEGVAGAGISAACEAYADFDCGGQTPDPDIPDCVLNTCPPPGDGDTTGGTTQEPKPEPGCTSYTDACDPTRTCWDSQGTISTDSRSVPSSCVCGEVVPSYGDSCTVGTGACERTGSITCSGSCSANAGTPSAEVCDGVDNDCDGSTDEGGVCDEEPPTDGPTGPSCTPSTEVCDGVDNDCDGSVDEGGVCDSQPPTTNTDALAGWRNEPVTLSFSASDAGSSVDWTEFCTGSACNPSAGERGNSVSFDSEGVHTVRYRSIDIVGNAESVRRTTVRIDLSEPGVTVAATKTESGAAYTGGWSNEPVELGVSCTDQSDLSGCDSGSGRLRLVDGPGVCPGEGDRFATDTYDRYGTGEGDILGDDAGDEERDVEEGEEDDGREGVTGTFYVCAGARDVAGNVGFGGASPDARPIRVDTASPVVSASATSPTNNPRETVSYTVEDQNLDDCSASGAGVSWSTSQSDDDNDGVYEGTATPQSDMDEGDHTVTVECTDEVENTGNDTVALVVDTTTPTVGCDACDSPDPVRSGNEIEFDPQVSDDLAGIASIEVCEDDAGSPNCADLYCSSMTSTSCGYETPDNTFATEDYWVRATDEAGNTADAVGPNSFTMKKWLGESCTTDEACLLGSCEPDPDTGQSVCQATFIPEPGIFLR